MDDWKDIDFDGAYLALTRLWYLGEETEYGYLKRFMKQVELLKEKQLQAHNKSIPALLRK